MAKGMNVADIGRLLLDPDVLGDDHELFQAKSARWSLLRVPAGTSWESPASTDAERALVVLDGLATFTVDDWRQSLGSGHILWAEPDATVSIDNETADDLLAILVSTPRLR